MPNDPSRPDVVLVGEFGYRRVAELFDQRATDDDAMFLSSEKQLFSTISHSVQMIMYLITCRIHHC